MKKIPALLLPLLFAVLVFGEEAAKKAPPPAVATLAAAEAKVTAPFVLKEGAIGQPEVTELSDGGKAVFEFSVPQAGEYVINAVVNASAEDSNSFFLNIDAPPQDPDMIWDIDVTVGFESRVVSWRGKNEADNDEFKPKRFKLAAGAHKLFLVGREPTQLKSFFIRAAGN